MNLFGIVTVDVVAVATLLALAAVLYPTLLDSSVATPLSVARFATGPLLPLSSYALPARTVHPLAVAVPPLAVSAHPAVVVPPLSGVAVPPLAVSAPPAAVADSFLVGASPLLEFLSQALFSAIFSPSRPWWALLCRSSGRSP